MDNNELAQRIAELPLEDEHIVHIYSSDLARMEGSETTATVFSVAVGCPDTGERSVPLYTADQVRAAQAPLIERIKELEKQNAELKEALGEIEWSNNSKWQSDRAKFALASSQGEQNG